jgi:hypothetical protein
MRTYSCQLLNINGVNDVRQSKFAQAESLVPAPSISDVEIAIEKRKLYGHTSPGIDQILADLIPSGGKTCSEIHKLINSV